MRRDFRSLADGRISAIGAPPLPAPVKRFPLPIRFVPCLAVSFWFALGESSFAEKDWAYQGGPLPTASSTEKSAEPHESVKVAGAPETFRHIAGMMDSLFAVGWADPRGGEYRELTIPGEERTADSGYPTTLQADGSPSVQQRIHGWLLPKAEGIEQRYAVGWDGLVYPVIEIGPSADLSADIEAALMKENFSPISGKFGLEPSGISLAKVVLLLRLGKHGEAAEMARRWEEAASLLSNGERPGISTWLVSDWLSAQLDRAIWAHRRGQHKLALAYLEQIPKSRTLLQEEAGKLDIRLNDERNSSVRHQDLELYFLNQVPELIADEKRRVTENVISRPEIADPESVADKTERIGLLIRDLEESDASQFLINKGYISFADDQVVKALVSQGEDAVEPLLVTLESDPRLTRAVDETYWTRWQPNLSRVAGVEEAALAALVGILRSRDQFPTLDLPYVNYGPMPPRLKREELAKVIRAYWEKYRGKPLVERWYGLLMDDVASPRVWAEAAENLTLRESQQVAVYGELIPVIPPQPGQPDPMRGEVLRHKAVPSISQLMAKRLREAYALGRESEKLHRAIPGTVFDPSKESADPFPMIPAEKLAKALAAWDGENELETLRWYSQELERAAEEKKNGEDARSREQLIRIYVARRMAGDETALADYARWVLGLDAKKYSTQLDIRYFAPLWLFPDDPALADVAKTLFLDPASPWRSSADGINPSWMALGANSPLVAVPEFRELLLERLGNQLVVGRVELKPDGRFASFQSFISNTSEYGGAESIPEPKQDFRLSDKIAEQLARVRGVPGFSPGWPKEKRDKVIAQISAFVSQYGDRWAARAAYLSNDFSATQAELHFPQRDRPATKEDVKNGTAIFASEGVADRRVWSQPERSPRTDTTAEWPAKARLVEQEGSGNSPAPDQEVEVWQAEEALVDGKWKRTFGVVAKNSLAAVSGEELIFTAANGSKGDGWNLEVTVEGALEERGKPVVVEPGRPVILQASLQNLVGAPRSFTPRGWDSGTSTTKDLGVTVRLEHSPGSKESLRLGRFGTGWKTLKARGEAEVTEFPMPSTLDTMQRADLLKFDLAQMFDLSAPGVYRVSLACQKSGLFGVEKGARVPMFEVKK